MRMIETAVGGVQLRILGVKKRLTVRLLGHIFDLGIQLPSDAQKRLSKFVNSQILSVVPSVSLGNMISVLKGMVLRHTSQIPPYIPVEEQIHIVNGLIVHQPL